jgi:gamma-tubulin complex component 3
MAGLVRSIDNAYQIASRRLFDVFFEKFKLMDHLRALKQYLLLGHGDFADQLMEALLYAQSRYIFPLGLFTAD